MSTICPGLQQENARQMRHLEPSIAMTKDDLSRVWTHASGWNGRPECEGPDVPRGGSVIIESGQWRQHSHLIELKESALVGVGVEY